MNPERYDDQHQQTSVKINASVDVGVARIIEILSRHPHLCTRASCQDDAGGREGRFYVFFTLKNVSIGEIAEFAYRLYLETRQQYDSVVEIRLAYLNGIEISFRASNKEKDLPAIEKRLAAFIEGEIASLQPIPLSQPPKGSA